MKKDKSIKQKKLTEELDLLKKELLKHKIIPEYKKNLDLSVNIKNLNKQLHVVKIKNIIADKNKNIIKDKKIGLFILRQQVITDLPPKELRNVVDKSKKDIKKGIVVGYSIFEGKVGVAVGVTNELIKKFDAVTLVKIAS